VSLCPYDRPWPASWIDGHADGDILVTQELADEMGLPSSGLSNEQLTTDVEGFVDRMLGTHQSTDLWDFFPALSLVSVSMVVYELWKRKQRGDISSQQFQTLAAKATGLKVGKILALTALLTFPVVGQVTGAILVARLLLSAKSTWFDRPPLYTPPLALQPA
jgi:hypothetical protein